jgi:hypothetical protein
VLVLVSTNANPLKDVRDLFRSVSNQEKPQFFDQDVSLYTKLSSEGKVTHFNSTLLHYDASRDKLFAHSQVPFWQNMMQYTAADADFHALHCNGRLYSNLAFGGYSDAEQTKLVNDIKDCAAMATQKGVAYYIVTDKASSEHLQSIFGNLVKIVD